MRGRRGLAAAVVAAAIALTTSSSAPALALEEDDCAPDVLLEVVTPVPRDGDGVLRLRHGAVLAEVTVDQASGSLTWQALDGVHVSRIVAVAGRRTFVLDAPGPTVVVPSPREIVSIWFCGLPRSTDGLDETSGTSGTMGADRPGPALLVEVGTAVTIERDDPGATPPAAPAGAPTQDSVVAPAPHTPLASATTATVAVATQRQPTPPRPSVGTGTPVAPVVATDDATDASIDDASLESADPPNARPIETGRWSDQTARSLPSALAVVATTPAGPTDHATILLPALVVTVTAGAATAHRVRRHARR